MTSGSAGEEVRGTGEHATQRGEGQRQGRSVESAAGRGGVFGTFRLVSIRLVLSVSPVALGLPVPFDSCEILGSCGPGGPRRGSWWTSSRRQETVPGPRPVFEDGDGRRRCTPRRRESPVHCRCKYQGARGVVQRPPRTRGFWRPTTGVGRRRRGAVRLRRRLRIVLYSPVWGPLFRLHLRYPGRGVWEFFKQNAFKKTNEWAEIF